MRIKKSRLQKKTARIGNNRLAKQPAEILRKKAQADQRQNSRIPALLWENRPIFPKESQQIGQGKDHRMIPPGGGEIQAQAGQEGPSHPTARAGNAEYAVERAADAGERKDSHKRGAQPQNHPFMCIAFCKSFHRVSSSIKKASGAGQPCSAPPGFIVSRLPAGEKRSYASASGGSAWALFARSVE